MSRQAEQSAFEHALDVNTLELIRFYVERLAFTRRGNFAFIAGMLYQIYNAASYAVTAGTPSTDAPIYASSSSLLANAAMVADGVLTVLLGCLLGFGVLFVLDAYEAKVGLSIDPDH